MSVLPYCHSATINGARQLAVFSYMFPDQFICQHHWFYLPSPKSLARVLDILYLLQLSKMGAPHVIHAGTAWVDHKNCFAKVARSTGTNRFSGPMNRY